MTLDEIVKRFSARKQGAGWMAKCPAHADEIASLSIGPGADGRVLVHCHAGCKKNAVLASAGLTMADLCPDHNDHRGPQIAATYDYTDESGTLLYQVVRLLPKGFRQRRPDGSGGWTWRLGDVRRVLFGLRELQGATEVWIPEGEKDVRALVTIGIIATTNPGGASTNPDNPKWRADYTQQLVKAGVKSVVILPDNDSPGRWRSEAIASRCHAAGMMVKIVELPGLPPKGDVSDWLDAGHTRTDLIEIVAATPIYRSTSAEPDTAEAGDTQRDPAASPNDTARPKKESQATAIVRLAHAAGVELFHTPGDDHYITIQVNDHREHHQLGSRGCRDFLTRLFYLETSKAPSGTALQNAIATLSGTAKFDGSEHEVHVRIAGANDRIYLDLGAASHHAIEITARGWQVIPSPPVRFRRPRGILPLPVPQRGGSITDLRRFVNVATDDDFVLLVAWLLAALRPTGPYPILVFNAEQGAAKTTTTRVLQRLSDPNVADVRRPPRNTEHLMIAASNGHVVVFDNLSRLADDLSDNLAVLATGAGLAVRQLYTNNEEALFQAQRPIILNGINQVATRGDLVDRALMLTLPTISVERRKDEATFWRQFDEVRPRILGALLDALSCGLRQIDHVHLERMPRMADFAIWGTAVEPACPWPDGTFLRVYAGNQRDAVAAILDGDPIADAAQRIAPWVGTATDFLVQLNELAPSGMTSRKDWFNRPRQMSDGLRRLAPALRRMGIDVTFQKKGHDRTRLIHIARVGASASSATSARPNPDVVPADVAKAWPSDASADASAGSSNYGRAADAADAADAVLQRGFRWDPTEAMPGATGPTPNTAAVPEEEENDGLF